MAIVAVPKPLREKLGEEGVDALIELFNQSQSEQKNNILEFVEEKFERRLAEEMKTIDRRISETEGRLDNKISETHTLIAETKAELSSKIAETEARLDGKIDSKLSETKAELIKWMFLFWVGQVGVIIGILFAFFK